MQPFFAEFAAVIESFQRVCGSGETHHLAIISIPPCYTCLHTFAFIYSPCFHLQYNGRCYSLVLQERLLTYGAYSQLYHFEQLQGNDVSPEAVWDIERGAGGADLGTAQMGSVEAIIRQDRD